MCYYILDLEIHQYQQDSKLLTILILTTKWILYTFGSESVSRLRTLLLPLPLPAKGNPFGYSNGVAHEWTVVSSLCSTGPCFLKKATCMTFYLLCQFLAIVDAFRF